MRCVFDPLSPGCACCVCCVSVCCVCCTSAVCCVLHVWVCFQPDYCTHRAIASAHQVDTLVAQYTALVTGAVSCGIALVPLASLMAKHPGLFTLRPRSARYLARCLALGASTYTTLHVRPVLDYGQPYALVFDNHHMVCPSSQSHAVASPNRCACGDHVSHNFPPSVCLVCVPATQLLFTAQRGQMLVMILRGVTASGLFQRVLGMWHAPRAMSAADLARAIIQVIEQAELPLARLALLGCDRVAYNIRAIRSLRAALKVCCGVLLFLRWLC